MERPIALIGMSNIGKSFWSEKLEIKGYQRFDIDGLIGSKLDGELRAQGYSAGLSDIARWMGQPFDPQYSKTSKRSLDLEEEATREALRSIEQSQDGKKYVIDTTGSVIYLPDDVLKQLHEVTQIVYLLAPDSAIEKMYQKFLEHPKPVIWGNSYSQISGETQMQSLGRCYSGLLKFRANKYAELAHITLDYDLLHSPNFTIEDFIDAASS